MSHANDGSAASHEGEGRDSAELWASSGDAPRGSLWLEHCRPLRIRATSALILVEIERTKDLRPDMDERFEDELRKLARGVVETAWTTGLQRPVVLVLVEPNQNRREVLDALAAKQEWHRGEYTLWPVKNAGEVDHLLQPDVEALQYGEDNTRLLAAERDVERVRAFAEPLRSEGRPSIADLVMTLFDRVQVLRPEEDDATPLSEEREGVGALVDRWLDKTIGERTEQLRIEQRRESALPLPLPLRIDSYGNQEGSKSLFFPATASEQDRASWRERYAKILYELRDHISRERPAELALRAQCTPAVAMYIGTIFHATTGIRLAVHQFNQRTAQEEIWSRSPGGEIAPFRLVTQVRSLGNTSQRDPVELQVRISVTQDVTADADAWTAEQDPSWPDGGAALALDLTVPDLGSTFVSNGDEAYAIALAVRRAIISARRKRRVTRLPVRIFFAGPSAVAVFIGAELNAMGKVLLMDFVKEGRQYVESFELEPGA
jgi:hypothetical protein